MSQRGRISRSGAASESLKAQGAAGAAGGGDAIASAAPADARKSRDVTDAEAIERARTGDHDAFRVLVERYQARAYRLAVRVLRDEELARDAVQDALVKAYGSLARFEGRSSFYTWLYRLVMNQCLDYKRRSHADRYVDWADGDPVEAAGADMPPPEVAGVSFAPAAEVMRKELRQHVADAISQLPDEPRQTLMLREIDGLSYAEIAKTLGIPKGTVMSRLHYARRRVQKLLIDAGVVESQTPESGSKDSGTGKDGK